MKKIKEIFIDYTENKKLIFFRYICTGGTVTLINIILLYVFTEFASINYVLSNIISMLICIIITYILSKKIIFTKKVKIGTVKEFISYIIIAIISIIIDTAIMKLLTEKLAIYYIISKIIATCISTVTNYILKSIIYDKYKC